jgi:hypothetical protein
MKKDQQDKGQLPHFPNENNKDKELEANKKDEWNDGIIQEKQNQTVKRDEGISGEENTLGNP